MSENALTIDGGKPALPAPASAARNGLTGVAALKARFTGLIQQPAVAKSLPLLGLVQKVLEPHDARAELSTAVTHAKRLNPLRIVRFRDSNCERVAANFVSFGRERRGGEVGGGPAGDRVPPRHPPHRGHRARVT